MRIARQLMLLFDIFSDQKTVIPSPYEEDYVRVFDFSPDKHMRVDVPRFYLGQDMYFDISFYQSSHHVTWLQLKVTKNSNLEEIFKFAVDHLVRSEFFSTEELFKAVTRVEDGQSRYRGIETQKIVEVLEKYWT
mgnify:CR=1 FL=1